MTRLSFGGEIVAMSVQEIEEAIKSLSPTEIDQLTQWIEKFRANSPSANGAKKNGVSKEMTLAEAMGDLIGCVGDPNGPKTSTAANASELFGDYLVQKKREGRL
jgi:hypothetical protein